MENETFLLVQKCPFRNDALGRKRVGWLSLANEINLTTCAKNTAFLVIKNMYELKLHLLKGTTIVDLCNYLTISNIIDSFIGRTCLA